MSVAEWTDIYGTQQSTKGFFEVAIEGLPEWNLNPLYVLHMNCQILVKIL